MITIGDVTISVYNWWMAGLLLYVIVGFSLGIATLIIGFGWHYIRQWKIKYGTAVRHADDGKTWVIWAVAAGYCVPFLNLWLFYAMFLHGWLIAVYKQLIKPCRG